VNRAASVRKIGARDAPWDIAVIGGGATGVGIAVDASARGHSVCLVERDDFGKGTSSRSTKLIHGGVRYLRQGNVSLVIEALRERDILHRNAPHLVHDLPFIVPGYSWWETAYYGLGLRLYDLLAFRHGFSRSRRLGREEVLTHIPNLEGGGLCGGVLYHDGQFDDARLLIDLARTAETHGAALLNYAPVVELTRDAGGRVNGLVFLDRETDIRHTVRAHCVINATGAFSDTVRRMGDPNARPMIAPSQGAHLVLDGSFLAGDVALMIPRTSDGRVLFAIPWQGHTLIGTTDTPIENVSPEPIAIEKEVAFLLDTAGRYLARKPKRSDVLSVFAGIRPLVKSSGVTTAALSRDHTIEVGRSGLFSIAGGKWTTYRQMAEDCVDHAARFAKLDERPCVTRTLAVPGPSAGLMNEMLNANRHLERLLHPLLPVRAVDVVWAVRFEMARTVEDVLSRRTRALLLNARAALDMVSAVAELMAAELGRDSAWQTEQVAQFTAVAQGYLLSN
jgi:glycerol-3-phosphate dehydrogenase